MDKTIAVVDLDPEEKEEIEHAVQKATEKNAYLHIELRQKAELADDSRCQVVIPGLGQCEVIGWQHEMKAGRLLHVIGACTWNGGTTIEVSDDALDEAAKRDRERRWDSGA